VFRSNRVPRLTVAAFFDQLFWLGMRWVRDLRADWPKSAWVLRRVFLVIWWSVTLQLHIQFRYWLRARRMRRAAVPEPAAMALIQHVRADLLAVPVADEPLVSVIIPSCGKNDFTLRCLASIAAHPPAAGIEVIVIDDAGPPQDSACLTQVRGIRLLRNATNQGFIRACNAAVGQARGDYLLFLNNDTQVLDDWLDPMLSLLQARPDAGAVGAKLLYPDGRLQEAGGIIWRDGSGWNFGRLEAADAARYNYVREVDYCSGAALMLPRALFRRLGGFDERYVPAYFEDADISFRLRAMGLKTLYQPRARVVHFEGVSHGRDVTAGVKAHQVTNRHTFLRQWDDVLAREHYPNGQHVLRACEHGRNRPVILVVDHQIPTPDRDAGSRTMVGFLRALVDSGLIVKFWPNNLFYLPGYTEALGDMGIEVFHGPSTGGFAAWIQANGDELDHVLLSRPDVAEDCMGLVRRHSRARIAYYGHDLHFRRMRQIGDVTLDEAMLRAADRMEERERAIWHDMDTVLYPSEEEAAIVRTMEPDRPAHAVVPYGLDRFGGPRAVPPGREILFVGGFGHPPNEDAVAWFVSQVMPRIMTLVPDADLTVLGFNPSARVRALAAPNVRVLTDISDGELAAIYLRARVAVVPLRCGAGVKLKVVEAMGHGVPVVTSPVGAQGLPGLEAVAAVAADEAAFAAAVADLLCVDALWEQRSAAGTAYAAARFTRARQRESLLAALGLARAMEVATAAG